jgi:fucose 4-O-acetylase-like acetyltransferase
MRQLANIDTQMLASAPSQTPIETGAASSRSVAIDIVRMLGLLIVVCGHVWTEYPIVGYVAVFFVIAGYLWSDKRSFRDDVQHRFRILIVPYVSWLIIVGSIAFVVKAAGGAPPLELAKLVANYILGGSRIVTPLTAYWFLTAIFFATVIYRYLRDRPLPLYFLALACALLATLAFPYVGKIPLSLGVGFCCIVFIAAGHGLRRIEASIPMAPVLALVVLVVCLGLIYTNISERMTLKTGDFGTPFLSTAVAILIASSAIILSKPLARFLPDAVGGMITSFVKLGTVIIVLHTLPLWLLPEGTSNWIRFPCAVALPLIVGRILLAFPRDSRVRTLLMPSR